MSKYHAYNKICIILHFEISLKSESILMLLK